jgi:TfoX/Sxy family transcriptional regulator of competence genes
MAFDEGLSQRLRDALGEVAGISEKRMMGGLCFLLNGNMLGTVNRRDGRDRLMFRVGQANEAEALARPGATIVVMGKRRMAGYVFVDAEACGDAELTGWVAMALSYVGNLPPK